MKAGIAPKTLQHSVVLVLFGIAIMAVYGASLNHEFVTDDIGITINAPLNNLFQPYSTSPLRSLLYEVTYRTFGLLPLAFRLPNLMFHYFTAVMMYLLIRRTFGNAVTILGTALFAVHPLATESVTWISGGVYPQYTFFMLASLLCYTSRKQPVMHIWSIFFHVLALLSSEKAIIYPLILLAYEWSTRTPIKKTAIRVLPFLLLSITTLSIHLGKLESKSVLTSTYVGDDLSMSNPLSTFWFPYGTYLELFLVPFRLSTLHSITGLHSAAVIVKILLSLSYLVALVVGIRASPRIAFWLLWFVIVLLPTTSPLRIAAMAAERYAYPAMIPLAVLSALIAHRYLRPLGKRVFWILTVIAISSFGVRTVFRNRDWQNQRTIILATIAHSPVSPKTMNLLAETKINDGKYDEAIDVLTETLARYPAYYPAYHNIGYAYELSGEKERAYAAYVRAIETNPKLWQSYRALGDIASGDGDLDQAISHYQRASDINPYDASLYILLGNCYRKLDRFPEAIDAYRQASILDPKNRRIAELIDNLMIENRQ